MSRTHCKNVLLFRFYVKSNSRLEDVPQNSANSNPGLVFSPGGNEAFLPTAFTRGAESKSKTSPRHLDENFFTDLDRNVRIPHGERPKTVGQSQADDNTRKRQPNRRDLQGIL